MTTGQAIRSAREQARLTQNELADRIGTTQAMIVRYEKDQQSPTMNRIRQIAKALNVRITDLITE